MFYSMLGLQKLCHAIAAEKKKKLTSTWKIIMNILNHANETGNCRGYSGLIVSPLFRCERQMF